MRLLGAKIGGQLICSDAKFTNPRAKDDTNAYAFSAEGTDVGRDLLLRGAKATGEVRLLGAKIGGQFICSVAVFTNPRAKDDTNAYAFNADGTEVGEICIFDSVKTTGMVRLLGAKIGRSLSCHNATFKNPGAPQYGKAHAFIGDGLEVDGDMLFTDAEASGMVRLLGAKIGGQLNCDGATFGNPRAGKGNEAYAFSADSMDVGESFFFRFVTATGGIRIVGAIFKSNLSIVEGEFSHAGGYAIDLEGAKIDATLFLMGIKMVSGSINLTHTRCGVLADDPSWWRKDALYLDGFEYRAVGSGGEMDVSERLRWLDCEASPEFRLQPYEQLIKVYRDMGHESDAREVAIAKQEALRKYGQLSWRGRAWNWTLGTLIAHGYRPWRVLLPALLVVILGTAAFGDGFNRGLMVPTNTRYLEESIKLPDQYPMFSALGYSIDAFVPIVDLRQQAFWVPAGNGFWGLALWGYMWFHIASGWVLTTIFVLGFTGVVRKD